jgi:hypothetical protein
LTSWVTNRNSASSTTVDLLQDLVLRRWIERRVRFSSNASVAGSCLLARWRGVGERDDAILENARGHGFGSE